MKLSTLLCATSLITMVACAPRKCRPRPKPATPPPTIPADCPNKHDNSAVTNSANSAARPVADAALSDDAGNRSTPSSSSGKSAYIDSGSGITDQSSAGVTKAGLDSINPSNYPSSGTDTTGNSNSGSASNGSNDSTSPPNSGNSRSHQYENGSGSSDSGSSTGSGTSPISGEGSGRATATIAPVPDTPTSTYPSVFLDAGVYVTKGKFGSTSTVLPPGCVATPATPPPKPSSGKCQPCSPYGPNVIPDVVPLPYAGGATTDGPDLCSAYGGSLSSLVENIDFPMDTPYLWNDIAPAQCGADYMQTKVNKISIQPNGGIQFAWLEKDRNVIHITYLDPNFKRVADDILVSGIAFAGLIAKDDGTILIASMPDCAAPMGRMNMAMMLHWSGGKLKLARRITDPYRKNDLTESKKVEDPAGNGHFVQFMDWGKTAYDAEANILTTYFAVSGGAFAEGGNHWGSLLLKISVDDGQVTWKQSVCSHDLGGRLISVGQSKFPFLCQSDGFGVMKWDSPGYINSTLLGKPAWSYGLTYQTVTPAYQQAGWAPSKIGSLVPRKDGSGFVSVILEKTMKKFFQIRFLFFDNNLALLNAVAYPAGDISIEFHNAHLISYGAQSQEKYLLYFTKTDMATSTCCAATGLPLEIPCYGQIGSIHMEVVTFDGTSGVSIGSKVQLDPNVNFSFVNPEDDLVLDRKGNVIFGSGDVKEYNGKADRMRFTRIRNCAAVK